MGDLLLEVPELSDVEASGVAEGSTDRNVDIVNGEDIESDLLLLLVGEALDVVVASQSGSKNNGAAMSGVVGEASSLNGGS